LNLSELKTLTVGWLDDPAFGYFTEDLVTSWLNNGLRTLHKRLILAGENWYSKCATVPTVVGQECYTLPSDFYKLESLRLFTGTNPTIEEEYLTHMTPQQAAAFSPNQGTPATFYLKKNCLILRPPPDTVKTMEVTYSYAVSPMVLSTDIPDAPEQYHEYIAVLATLDGLFKDQRNAGEFIAGKRDFYDAMLAKDAEDRLQDVPRMVVETMGDSAGWIW
jgi:hypothetical protein